MNFLFTLAAFAVALGVLIVVHEYGHYLVAKLFGIKVLRFSIGFGRPLISWHRGADRTEWAIAAFPLGGYVQMLDEREGEVAPHELHRAFNRQPVRRRMAVASAGPLANFALAIALYWLLFLHGVPGIKPILGSPPPATPAATAAISAGDIITMINKEAVVTWDEVRWVLLQHAAGKEKTVEVQTAGEYGEIRIHNLDLSILGPEDLGNDFVEKLGLVRFRPPLPAKIGQLVPRGVAARAGLKPGDEIVAVDGKPLQQWDDFVTAVRQHPGQPLELTIKRAGAEQAIRLTPETVKENGMAVGRIGAAPMTDPALLQKLQTEVRYPPLRALREALRKTWSTSAFTVQVLGKMLIGEASWRNISGPIAIADYAGQSAQLGWVPYLSFLALISVSLAVLNLLPIPLLDGGHLMYYMAEIIKGSPVSEKAMEIGQKIGIAILLILMAFAFYNDITRLITG